MVITADDKGWQRHSICAACHYWILSTGTVRCTTICIWCDCIKDNVECLGLSQKDAQFRNKWRRIKGASS